MPSPEISLFRAFPRLRERLPRLPLVETPTPVEPLALDGARDERLWVKRDERSCPLYGGNKPRKLEFVLGTARARGARRLVTTGAFGTHHGLATALLGRHAGMQTTVVVVPQPLTDEVRETLRLLGAWGARVVEAPNVPMVALRVVQDLARGTLRGERPFLVATGGSSRRGDAGFVSAGLELAEQVRAGACPEFAQVYVPVGTGGTLVGLAAGFALAGLRARLVGVLVTDILPPSASGLARAARRVLRWLRRLDPALPAARVDAADFDLVTRQLGAGYGAATSNGEAAEAAAAACGLHLEPTYTAKCLAEVRARRLEGVLPDAPVLFWNTFNAVDVAARAPRPLDGAGLPARLRRIALETPHGGRAPAATPAQSSSGASPAK